MADQPSFGPPATPEEVQQLGQILHQCFNFPIDGWQDYTDRLGLENCRVLRSEDRVVAGLGIYAMGQWFGGQSVPTAGLAAVGVAPEYRGSGLAGELLHQVLLDCRTQGIPLSTLYASTQRLYRKVGYEQAGNACRFSLPIADLTPGDRSLAMHPVEAGAINVVQDLYRQSAQRTNGNLDRHPGIWERILKPPPEAAVYSYLVGPKTQPQGYVIFTQQAAARGYTLQVRDWVTLTPAAEQRLWTFWADHRSLAQEVHWQGPAVEPRLLLLPEQTYKINHLERWFLRIVDVPQALRLRGYPPGLEATLHLQVHDPLIPENSDGPYWPVFDHRWLLSVANGRAEVSRGGSGDLKLDVRALAPLYTGLLTPHQLQGLGQLQGTPAALATASLLFAGSEPWMPDHF